MEIIIESKDYDLFNKLVDEISIMLPVQPFSKPYIYYVDWRNLSMKLFASGDYYHIFIAMLKKYILEKKIKITMNLQFYPLAIYDEARKPTDDWLITI